jgi:oligopeptide/dipeptide ABC transporter ATP-binding protein
MYGGRIVEEGGAAALFERPLHPYTAGLLRSTPRRSDRKERLDSIDGTPPNLLSPPSGCSFAARCAWVSETCTQNDPPLAVAAGGRTAACWLVQPPSAAPAPHSPGPPIDA